MKNFLEGYLKNEKIFKTRLITWSKEKLEYVVRYYESSDDILDLGTMSISVEPDSSYGESSFDILHLSEINFPGIGIIKENVRVITDRSILRPIETQITLRINDVEEKATARYERSNLKLIINKSDGNDGIHNLKIPHKILDNYNLITVLRTIDFEKQKSDSFSLFNIPNGQLLSIQLKYKGRENVVLPIGNFECDRIEISYKYPYPIKQFLLFTTQYPYFFVKSIKNQEVIELVKSTLL